MSARPLSSRSTARRRGRARRSRSPPSPSRWDGTGTLKAETMASTIVLAVSMASSVPISGRSSGATRPRRCRLSSITIALEPVTETMRPIDCRTSRRRLGVRLWSCLHFWSNHKALAPASPIISDAAHRLTRSRAGRQMTDLGAHAFLRCGSQLAAVQLHERFGDRQAEACAFAPARVRPPST